MSKHDYTNEEMTINDYLILELKARNNLSEHLTAIMAAFKDPNHAIDSVMDQDDRNSLMCYLTKMERYEDCQWLLDSYNRIFIKPIKLNKYSKEKEF